VERRERAIAIDAVNRHGGTDVQWKAAAFARWHEPDDARYQVRFCERLGVKFPGLLGKNGGYGYSRISLLHPNQRLKSQPSDSAVPMF